jgi:hypothetical protein
VSILSLEERLIALEAEVAQLKKQVETEKSPPTVPWWEQRFGAFKDDPDYEEAMCLGREYRESLRPKDAASEGISLDENEVANRLRHTNAVFQSRSDSGCADSSLSCEQSARPANESLKPLSHAVSESSDCAARVEEQAVRRKRF